METFYVGTAAWSIPKDSQNLFPESGSHLVRYAQKLKAVEINTSFYRDHKAVTYERWAETVPADFRFSVKLSKVFTHEMKLEVETDVLEENLNPILKLGEKLGCLLVQIPPKLAFRLQLAEEFFSNLRQCYEGPIAFEPRHETWATRGAERVLEKFRISQVIADPEPFPEAQSQQRHFSGISYYRLHGSPEIYKSAYDSARLKLFKEQMQGDSQRGIQHCWCIFDNTTFGYATLNALELQQELRSGSPSEMPFNSALF
jgi:uncharacterized protein YecE (DUF72 family)